MRDEQFEWDDRKAATNLRKHGISFEVGRRVFDDPGNFEGLDESEDYGEERFLATGIVSGVFLTVSYTERGKRVRIISARRATQNEQDDYFIQNG